MMKILLLAPQPFFEIRGTPINVRLVATALSEIGYSVDLLVYPHGNNVHIANTCILRIPKVPGLPKAPIGPSKTKLIYDVVMFFHASLLLIRKKYCVIHAVEESALMAWILSKLFRIPYIFDMDSHMSEQLKTSKFIKTTFLLNLAKHIENAAFKSASAIITVCPHLTAVAKTVTEPRKVFQIEDIPMEFPSPPNDMTVTSLRNELGITSNDMVILYTGNLEAYQGIDLILESAMQVATENSNSKFVIVGGEDEQIGKYIAKRDQLGLEEKVLFTGTKPLEHMPVFHDLADILLSPRIQGENTPLKLYTYLKTGKPIVATDLPTHTQLLNKNIAVLAKAEKVEYASAILLLLSNKELRTEIGRKGREFVEDQFNYQKFKHKLGQVYKTIAT